MKYLNDFNSMLAKKFISDELLQPIIETSNSGLNHLSEVKMLNSELDNLESYELESVKRVLKIMTKLSCIKELYKMKVTLNVLKNINGENKYVQARGAISVEKAKRVLVAHYIDLSGFENNMDGSEYLKHLIREPEFKKMAREQVINKIEPELKSINGL